jgi:hypothetical protein
MRFAHKAHFAKGGVQTRGRSCCELGVPWLLNFRGIALLHHEHHQSTRDVLCEGSLQALFAQTFLLLRHPFCSFFVCIAHGPHNKPATQAYPPTAVTSALGRVQGLATGVHTHSEPPVSGGHRSPKLALPRWLEVCVRDCCW